MSMQNSGTPQTAYTPDATSTPAARKPQPKAKPAKDRLSQALRENLKRRKRSSGAQG